MYLTIEKKEHPYPQIVFYDAKTQEAALVNLKGQQFATYFAAGGKKFEKRLKKLNVVHKLDDARKIQKWIKFMRM